MKTNDINERLSEIQTELIRISLAVSEANRPLGITVNGRPAPATVERSHQDLYDVQARIARAANQIDKLRMDLKQEEEENGKV